MLTNIGKKILLKIVLDFVTIMFPAFGFGKKYILKCVPIFWKKSLLKVLFDIATIEWPTFLLRKKFILKFVLNISEENSSDISTWYVCHYVSFFDVWEEIYSETFTEYLGRKSFWKFYSTLLPLSILILHFWRNLYSNCSNNLLKIVLDIVNIIYHTFISEKKFILKWVPSFRKKFLLKMFLTIVNTEYSTSNLRRNSLWNLYQYFGRKFFWNYYLKLLPLSIKLFIFGSKILL